MLLLYKVCIQWSSCNCCDIPTSTVPDNVKLTWYNHESDEISEANVGNTSVWHIFCIKTLKQS